MPRQSSVLCVYYYYNLGTSATAEAHTEGKCNVFNRQFTLQINPETNNDGFVLPCAIDYQTVIGHILFNLS